MSNVSEIRNPINVARLKTFLSNVQPSANVTLGFDSIPAISPGGQGLEFKQFKFGQSNPTYLIHDKETGSKLVLRRKPSLNAKLVSRTAHAIEREFFILRGINKWNSTTKRKVPVPKVYALVEDESITDAVFYIMEFIDGRQITNPELNVVPEFHRALYWDAIMDTITAIHSIDTGFLVKELPASHFPQFQPEKLAKLKNGPSYFQRQIKTLTGIANLQNKTVKPIPHFDKIIKWLAENSPKDPEVPTLIHGDFKIDNLIFDFIAPKVITVLDWELCTFGHPLFDLANFLQPFQLPNKLNKALYKDGTEIGLENPDNVAQVQEKLIVYHNKLGHYWNQWDKSNNALEYWTAGYVFGLLRLSIISQGIAMRIAKGSASSAEASSYGALYPLLANLAVDAIDKARKAKI